MRFKGFEIFNVRRECRVHLTVYAPTPQNVEHTQTIR